MTNDDNYRVDHDIEFFIMDVPEDANITWNINDLFSFRGNHFITSFNISNTYVINCTARWENNVRHGSISIDVLNSDEIENIKGDRIISVSPARNPLYNLDFFVFNGVIDPTVNININIRNIIGRCRLFVGYHLNDNDPAIEIHDQEYRYYNNNNLFYEHTVTIKRDFFESNEIRFQVFIEFYEGKSGPWSIECESIY